MALLKYGSRGSEVKKLQEALNNAGYQLDTDGIYGNKTQSAVKKYQKANGLSVDGIVGDATWGALNKASTPTTDPTEPETKVDESLTNPEETTKTEDATATKDALQAILDQKPSAYQSPYADKLNELYDQIMNRKAFSYDFNADPIYQQYKDRYVQQGQRAMQDTMANAAALTGGYGNSYASTAGNLAYQQYLSGLNDVIPDLYQNAYNKYTQEGQDLYNLLTTTQDMDQTDYDRYLDEYNKYLSDRDFEYQRQQDELSQSNWEKQFAYETGEQAGMDNSPAYATVLNNAKTMKSSKVLSYLQSMVDGGYITQAEADYIYAVELAGGVLSSSSGSSGSKKSSGNDNSNNSTDPTDTDTITYRDYVSTINDVAAKEGAEAANNVAEELKKLYGITNIPEKFKNSFYGKHENQITKNNKFSQVIK